MNLLLTIGLLLMAGYSLGWALERFGLPKIIGYILAGVLFSPNTLNLISPEMPETIEPLMDVCLSFIAFEVGGALKWSVVKKHRREIINITLLASIFPFILIASAVFIWGWMGSAAMPFDLPDIWLLACLLGALASPTAPAATLAVIHQYKARGNVSDTIMGVAALDDVLGIVLFSITLGAVTIFTGDSIFTFVSGILETFFEIFMAMLIGVIMAVIMDATAGYFKITREGQWMVLILALLLVCTGVANVLKTDHILTVMIMGVVVVNKSQHHRTIFRILTRYTEDLIFLVFFVFSGLLLDVSTIPKASGLIFVFVLLRTIGKVSGAYLGGKLAHAPVMVQRYTAGGLLPQAGIVIGLILNIYQLPQYQSITELLLATIMGATIIHEIIGPAAAKYSLMKSGEIRNVQL